MAYSAAGCNQKLVQAIVTQVVSRYSVGYYRHASTVQFMYLRTVITPKILTGRLGIMQREDIIGEVDIT